MIGTMTESLAGKLLVASPLLVDPNFRRSVVLMCLHVENGAMGLILNRPVETALVSDHLPEWTQAVAPPGVLFRGGPVEPASALALARIVEEEPRVPWTPIAHHTGLIDLSRSPDEFVALIDRVRIFGGYAGWGAVQLQDELAEKAWFVLESWPSDLFTDHPESLWSDVLRRQGGDLALMAHYPDDPSLN
jgi:putative transcriptional regulator